MPQDKILKLPLESLVEAILNHGSMESVRSLFEAFGIQTIAAIFRQQLQNKRPVYLPQVQNYFSLYFDKHAPRNP